MAAVHDVPGPALIEPIPVPDVFVTGFIDPEDCGDYVRITYYADRPVHFGAQATYERVVMVRIIFTKDSYNRALAHVLRRHGVPPQPPQLVVVA